MKATDFLLFLFLGFAVFRVTRFLLKDTLIERQRMWLLHRIAKAKAGPGGMPDVSPWRMKLLQLVQCAWCLSIWVAGMTELVVWHYCSIRLPLLYFPALSAVSLVFMDMVEDS